MLRVALAGSRPLPFRMYQQRQQTNFIQESRCGDAARLSTNAKQYLKQYLQILYAAAQNRRLSVAFRGLGVLLKEKKLVNRKTKTYCGEWSACQNLFLGLSDGTRSVSEGQKRIPRPRTCGHKVAQT